MRELAVLLLGPEVNGGPWPMVSFVRKMTAVDCTRPEALLTGGLGCRWLLHEGEWVRPFWSAQRWTRWTGGGAHRQTEEAARSRATMSVEQRWWRRKGETSAQRVPFIAARAGGRRGNNGGCKLQWEQRWCHSLDAGVWSWRCRSDSGADSRAPHGLLFFWNFQNEFKLVNSNHIPSISLKFLKFCIQLDWSILKNFLNCSYFKFPTEIMFKILEPIQYLNLL
jgi:hypothetical protein